MKLIKTIPIAVFFIALLCTGRASASITSSSITSLPDSGELTGTVGGGSFENFWTFHLGVASTVDGQVTNNYFGFNGNGPVFQYSLGLFHIQNITGLTVDLYEASLGSSVTNPLSYSAKLLDSDSSPILLSSGLLASGDYALKVSGTAEGFLGGKYTGQLTVTPVPEPETWLMLLVGVILLGAQLRRKNATQNGMMFVG